jgi:ABC-type phosphate/phosphonate transport system substrate-binding protein
MLGAVAYDPKVVTIWDGFQAFFEKNGLPFDYLLTTTYERLVALQLDGQVDVAWNSPLAWLQTLRGAPAARAIAMRDSDQDLRSVIVVRADSPYRALADLDGARVALGAADSPQATLIPALTLADAGARVQPVLHDVLLGKHGDHIGGERDAARALAAGSVEAAAVLDANLLLFQREGTLPGGTTRVIGATNPFDHCNFTLVRDVPGVDRFTELLLGMSYDDPEVRGLMDLEGLKQWRPGRVDHYGDLSRAIARFGDRLVP